METLLYSLMGTFVFLGLLIWGCLKLKDKQQVRGRSITVNDVITQYTKIENDGYLLKLYGVWSDKDLWAINLLVKNSFDEEIGIYTEYTARRNHFAEIKIKDTIYVLDAIVHGGWYHRNTLSCNSEIIGRQNDALRSRKFSSHDYSFVVKYEFLKEDRYIYNSSGEKIGCLKILMRHHLQYGKAIFLAPNVDIEEYFLVYLLSRG